MASNRREHHAPTRQEEGSSQAAPVQGGGGGPRHDHRRKEEASEEVIAQKPETKLRAKIVRGLKSWEEFDIHVFHPHGSQFGRNALDLVGCANGAYFEIEIKVHGPATTAQQVTIDKVIAAGGISGVAHSLAEVKELILNGFES